MKKKDDLIWDSDFEIDMPEERTISPKTESLQESRTQLEPNDKKIKTDNDKSKKSTNSKTRSSSKTRTVHTPIVCNYLIQGVNELSDNQYLAVSYTGGVAVSVAQAKINQQSNEIASEGRYLEHNDHLKFDSELLSARFAFVQSIINVAFNSFLFGFLVCLLSNLFQVFLRRKESMSHPTFKKLFKKSLICGLISLGFGLIIIGVMLPISIVMSELLYETSALLYIRLISIGVAFFIAFIVSLICFSSQTSSFKLGLLQAVKVLPRFFIYIVAISLLQLVLPDLAVVIVAVAARILMVYLIELKDSEKKKTSRY